MDNFQVGDRVELIGTKGDINIFSCPKGLKIGAQGTIIYISHGDWIRVYWEDDFDGAHESNGYKNCWVVLSKNLILAKGARKYAIERKINEMWKRQNYYAKHI
jgi:signal peptidase I